MGVSYILGNRDESWDMHLRDQQECVQYLRFRALWAGFIFLSASLLRQHRRSYLSN